MFKVINGLTIDFKNKLVWGLTQEPRSWNKAKDLEKDSWRLPTIDELKQACIDKVPGFISHYFWSSSPYFNYTGYSRVILFYSGYTDHEDERFTYYVRYVKPLDSLILKELNFTIEIL